MGLLQIYKKLLLISHYAKNLSAQNYQLNCHHLFSQELRIIVTYEVSLIFAWNVLVFVLRSNLLYNFLLEHAHIEWKNILKV